MSSSRRRRGRESGRAGRRRGEREEEGHGSWLHTCAVGRDPEDGDDRAEGLYGEAVL